MGTSRALTFPPAYRSFRTAPWNLRTLPTIVIDTSRRTITQQILADYDYANSRYEFVIYFVKWEGGTGE